MARYYKLVMTNVKTQEKRYLTIEAAMRNADRYIVKGYSCVLLEVNESGSGKVNTREHEIKKIEAIDVAPTKRTPHKQKDNT